METAKEKLIKAAWEGASEQNKERGNNGVNAAEALEWLAEKYLIDMLNDC